jgi:hypothetical protein
VRFRTGNNDTIETEHPVVMLDLVLPVPEHWPLAMNMMKGSFAFMAICLAAQQGASAAAPHALNSHKHKPPWIPSSKSPPRCLPCGNTSDSHNNQSDSFRLHNGASGSSSDGDPHRSQK